MKRIFKLSFVLIALLFVSCATLENIVVLNSTVGSNLFMRNVMLKTKNSKISNVEFDITTNVVKTEITKNPVVNYTYTATKNNYAEAEKAVFQFENNGKRYGVISPEFMFRALDSKKNMQVRFTSEINKDEFAEIMKNYEPVKVVITLSDGSEIVISDKSINEKFNDLRLLVN